MASYVCYQQLQLTCLHYLQRMRKFCIWQKNSREGKMSKLHQSHSKRAAAAQPCHMLAGNAKQMYVIVCPGAHVCTYVWLALHCKAQDSCTHFTTTILTGTHHAAWNVAAKCIVRVHKTVYSLHHVNRTLKRSARCFMLVPQDSV